MWDAVYNSKKCKKTVCSQVLEQQSSFRLNEDVSNFALQLKKCRASKGDGKAEVQFDLNLVQQLFAL